MRKQLLKISCLLFLLLSIETNYSIASDVVAVLPLTNKILMLHFDDGYAQYHTKGQARDNEYVVTEKLDVSRAVEIDSCQITNENDSDYAEALHRVDIGRNLIIAKYSHPFHDRNQECSYRQRSISLLFRIRNIVEKLEHTP